MTEKIKILALAILLEAGLMLASFFAGWKIRGEKMPLVPVADTVRIHTVDTVKVVEEIHDTTILTYYKTIQVPFSVVEVDTVVDSARVTLPYERHFASLDSVADVWYSGYDAKIDSAVVYKHHTTEIVNHFRDVTKMPRLTFDIGAAAFYSDKSINPCLVGGMRYNAKKTTWSAYGAVNHEGKWGAGVGVTYRLNIIK